MQLSSLPRLASSNRQILILRWSLVAAIAAFAGYFAAFSIHWPMMDDAPVMHYVNFLMAHGLRPYSDITDNNMPGAYLTENWAMHLFGATDLAWRIYDFFLLALLTGAMIVIAWPHDWFAGLLAGGLFLVVHASEGPRYAAEREEVITVLLAVGCAALFLAVRHRLALLMLVFGLTTALAATIKPTFLPLPIFLLILAVVVLRRRGEPLAPYLGWAIAGASFIFALAFRFLLHYHVLSQFLFLLRVVTPSYVALRHPPFVALLLQAFPRGLLALIPATIALVLSRGAKWTWEQWALLAVAAFGLFSYFAQQKAFYHHRYTWIAFFFLLCALQLAAAARSTGWPRLLAAATLAYVLFFAMPRYTQVLHSNVSRNDVEQALERDLRFLGGGAPEKTLQSQVECFDLVSGCLNALYHLGVVQNSGFTGDLLFFRQSESPAVRFYRDEFWERVRQNPPNFLVISNEWFGEPDSFGKVDTWPEFADFLHRNYSEVVGRDFPMKSIPLLASSGTEPRAYRIYVRNATALVAQAQPEAAH